MISENCYFFECIKPSSDEELGALFHEIKAFYKNTVRRTRAVFLRDDAVMQNQISKGLFLTVRNDKGTIVAGSALYPHSNGQPIDFAVSESGAVIEKGRVVELTSVLRMKYGKEDIELSPGIWNSLLFSIPMIVAFEKAGSSELPMDALLCDIEKDRINTINHITGVKSTNSPLRWEQIIPSNQLKNNIKSTTHDGHAGSSKNYFRASVSNICEIAEYLLDCSTRGYVTNFKGQKTYLDFSGLGLQAFLEEIVENDWLFYEKMKNNMSWAEARSLMDSVDSETLRANKRRLISA